MKNAKLRKWFVVPPMLLLALTACSRDPKARAQRYVNNGNKFFDKGRYKDASIMYRSALNADRRFGEAYYRLALADMKLFAYGDAFKALLSAVELQPTNTNAKGALAEMYMVAATQTQNTDRKNENLDNSKEQAEQLLKLDPNSFQAHRLLGQIALVRNDLPRAILEFETANTIKPLQSEVVVSYIQALAASDRFPEAEKLALQMIDKDKTLGPIYDVLYTQYAKLKRFGDAERILKLEVANNPQSSAYLLQLATFYVATKRLDDADAVLHTLSNEKDHPDGHLLAGDFFYRIREFDRARAEYEAGSKALPKDKLIFQKRLIELDARTGDTASANQLLAAILKDNPKDSEAIAMRAALMLTSGNRDQINMAVGDLQALVNRSPANYVLRYNLAQALHSRGENDAAIVQLEEAIKRRPDYNTARELLGQLYLARGDNPKALKTADEIISGDPNNLAGRLVRAQALLTGNDRIHARQELDYIVKNYPDNLAARYAVGNLDLRDKDYKSAAEIFGKLYKENPKDLRGLLGVVETLAGENRVPDAIAEVNKAIASDPDRQDLKIYLANLYLLSKRYDEAIALFQGLLAKDPKNARLLNRLADAYHQKGDLDKAMENLRAASKAAPTDLEPLLTLGVTLTNLGRRDEAIPVYEQILKINPDEALALNNLALILADKGADLERALSMAQRARQKAPNSSEIEDTLGWIYVQKNLSEEAVRVFRDLVVKDPDNPTYHYHYGMALLEKGDKPSTKRELEEALKDLKDHPDKNSQASKTEEAEIRGVLAKL